MSYGSIPTTPASKDDLEPCTEKAKGYSRNLGICLAVLLGALALMSRTKTPVTDPVEVPPPPELPAGAVRTDRKGEGDSKKGDGKGDKGENLASISARDSAHWMRHDVSSPTARIYAIPGRRQT